MTRCPALEDHFTLSNHMDGLGGGIIDDWNVALKIAGGDVHRIWTITSEDYEDGPKAWNFRVDDREDLIEVIADDYDEAYEKVEEILRGDDPDNDDFPEPELETPVYLIENPGTPGETRDYATDMFAAPGGHLVNRLGYVVTEEPWDNNTENCFRW